MQAVRDNRIKHHHSIKKGKSFGYFKCFDCNKTWMSAHAQKSLGKHVNSVLRTFIHPICGKMIIQVMSQKKKL
jgi:hypothetical protein